MDDRRAEGEWRRAVRAVILSDVDHVLLCRFTFPHPAVPRGCQGVWAAPGGGIEAGELPLDALRRELLEETGFVLEVDPPHVWHQKVETPGLADGYTGLSNDYYSIRTPRFAPRGSLPDEDLVAEHISDFRWWRIEDLAAYDGSDLFSPRDIVTPLAAPTTGGAPATPVLLGL